MGGFYSMSGVARASRTDVVQSLEKFASSRQGRMFPTPGGNPRHHLVISGEESSAVTVVYPKGFLGWVEASNYLSESLGAPVFSFHIHDEDLWMYVLFSNGKEVDRFNPIPDYWFGGLTADELSEWKGDAEVVARTWSGVDASSIKNYLVTWDQDDENPGRAYDDDEHPIGDCWQLTDFMRKLGLLYPIVQQGQAQGETYTFDVIMKA